MSDLVIAHLTHPWGPPSPQLQKTLYCLFQHPSRRLENLALLKTSGHNPHWGRGHWRYNHLVKTWGLGPAGCWEHFFEGDLLHYTFLALQELEGMLKQDSTRSIHYPAQYLRYLDILNSRCRYDDKRENHMFSRSNKSCITGLLNLQRIR